MDIIGNEVTQRIRAAITNKLKEVGVYVDDELPDYIMVMVANKKSKEQMLADLMLFLGTSTKSFTIWLHELLDNLQATTSVEAPKPAAPVQVQDVLPLTDTKPVEPPAPVKEESTAPVVMEEDNEEIITFQTELETDDVLMQELEKEDMLLESQKAAAAAAEKKVNKASLKSLVTSQSPERPPAPHSKTSVKVRPIFHRKTAEPSSHRPTKSYNTYYSNDEDDDGDDKYDPRNPSVNSLVSVVYSSQRKSSVPRELQANKLLLLKAMEDANKSVIHAQRKAPAVSIEPYEPTPIAKLKRPILKVRSQASRSREEVPKIVSSSIPEESLKDVILQADDDDNDMLSVVEEDAGTIHVPVNSAKVTLVPPKRKLIRDSIVPLEAVPKNPRFVVTLDGVDPSEFLSPKTMRSVISERSLSTESHEFKGEEEEEEEYEDDARFHYDEQSVEPMQTDMDEEDLVAKRPRLLVRCRKWPACVHGDACRFHHPTIHCKMFPSCTFGNKCLYIHPNCKYDSFCKKTECPFTHAGKRKTAPPSAPVSAPPQGIAQAVCKFHPDCLNPNCTFFHPKNCRFGLQCKNPGCQFTHPVSSVAPPHQLKWTAPKLSLSSRKFSLPTSEHMHISIAK